MLPLGHDCRLHCCAPGQTASTATAYTVVDEDITGSDTTTPTFNPKVKRFFAMIVLDTFAESMLRHDVCSLSISEIVTWIKKSVQHTWKAWRTKEVDWGPSPSITHVLH